MNKIARHRPLRFLVVRTDRIGDVVLSMPVLTALKKSFQPCKVTMLLRNYTADIVRGHPDVDKIIIDDREGSHRGWKGVFALANEIKKERFDAIILLHPTTRLAVLSVLAGIPLRIGTGYRLYSVLFNRKVFLHRKRSTRHELDLNLDMVKSIGAGLESVAFKFHIPAKAKERVDHLLQTHNINAGDKFIVIHPGSGRSAPEWPPEQFAQLAIEIISDFNLPVLIIGTQNEKNLVEQVWSKANKKPIPVIGRLNIKELAAILQRCSVLIANSTGPLHIANAVGSEVIGLFCAQQPFFPERWGPYNKSDSVITTPGFEDCANSRYLKGISVSQVLEMLKRKI